MGALSCSVCLFVSSLASDTDPKLFSKTMAGSVLPAFAPLQSAALLGLCLFIETLAVDFRRVTGLEFCLRLH